MTVLEAIQKSTEFLAKKGVDSPRLQTELLLAHLLKLPRMKLYLNFERTLTPAETDALREFIKRRGQREPLQHITGSTSFCGLEIAVNRHALVPRPETEMLAESGLGISVETRTIPSPGRRPPSPRRAGRGTGRGVRGFGFRHRHRLHRHCAGGKMSVRKNRGDGHFTGCTGVGQTKRRAKQCRRTD